MELFKLEAFGSVFCDAFIGTESNELLFISLIGTQTEMRRLQAAITLGENPEAGGISNLRGIKGSTCFNLRIANSSQLGQHAGVIPKTLFGDLVQLWVYNKTLLHELDYVNGIGYFILGVEHSSTCATPIDIQIWQMIKAMADIPLLDDWQDCVMLHGARFYRVLGDVSLNLPCIGIKIDLSNGFTDFIQDLLTSGELKTEAA